MGIDIASLTVRLDTAQVEQGEANLDSFVGASARAEDAVESLARTSKETSGVVAEVGGAAAQAAGGVSAMDATTRALAETEAAAKERIREMVQASLQKQQAMLATAAATREASAANRALNSSQQAGGGDALGSSFAATQQELSALSEALEQQAQSLEDVGERRAWVNDLYERGLLSFQDSEQHLKTLDRQERQVQASIAAHAREVDHLLRTYDPASAAIQRITEDEKKLERALRSGSISAQQHAKAMAGLQVSRARWQAEAQGVQQLSNELRGLSLTSSTALRSYVQIVGALGRGDLGSAAQQASMLTVRAGGLRAALVPLGIAAGATAAAATALTVSFYKGEQEAFEFERAITLTGNAVGITTDRLQEMSGSLGDISTRGRAAQVLAELAATGKVAARNLEQFAEAALRLERVGQPIEDTVRALTELGRSPVEASLKLNESLNYLTVEIYKQIRAFEQQGDSAKAAELAQTAYAQAADERARRLEEQLGTLQRIARGTGDAFKWMWDRILDVGRPGTYDEQIAKLQSAFSALQANIASSEAAGGNPIDQSKTLIELQQRIEALRDLKAAERDAANEQAKRAKAFDEHIAQERESLRLGQMRKSMLEETSKIQLAGDVAAIQRSLSESLSGYAAYAAQLEALRESDLVGDREYYAAKRELVERDAEMRERALQSESSRVGAEIERLKRARDEAGRTALETRGGLESSRIEAEAPFIREITRLRERQVEIESALAEIRRTAASELGVLSQEEERAADATKRAFSEAREAAQAYLDVVTKARERELESFGRGDRQRDFNHGLNEIDDRFADERRRLDERLSRKEIDQSQYDELLALAEEFRDKDLAGYEAYWERRSQLESDWSVGARESLANYIDSARNVAEQSERLFTNAFESMEDALVEFALTGKGSFKDLANSIIADLLRIQIRAALAQAVSASSGGFLSFLGGLFGGGGGAVGAAAGGAFSGPRAEGGPVDAGRSYLVGERGPELIVPRYAGTVIPNDRLGMSGPRFNFNTTINAGPGTSMAQLHAVLDERDAAIENRIAENLGRGRWAQVTN